MSCVHLSMFVPSSAPLLIKIHVILCGPKNSGASMDKLHTSTEPLWLNLLWLTRRVFPLHLAYYTHNIIFIITHCLASTCLWNLGTSPSLVNWIVQLNYTVELVSKFQGSYSYNAGDSEKRMFQFHLSSWKIPTKDLKVRFQLRERNQQFIQMCATLHLGLVEKNNKECKSRVQTSKNLSDATVHPNYFKTRERKQYMNTLGQTDSRKHAKLKKIKVQLESDIIW